MLKTVSTFDDGDFNVEIDANDFAIFKMDGILGVKPADVVTLTYYDASKMVVGDTTAQHFLVGTRLWKVRESNNKSIMLSTWASETPNGLINDVGTELIGWDDGRQTKIWTSYFDSIAKKSKAIKKSDYKVLTKQGGKVVK